MRREWLISLVMLAIGAALLQYSAAAEAVPDRASFAEFPYVLDGRQSFDAPLSAPVLEKLALTDYVSRSYRAPGRLEVGLYIGFYASQRTGVTYHSPLNCLPGSGWQVLESGHAPLTGPDGKAAEVNEIVIGRGLDRRMVLYWYQDRGRIIASEYLAKIYLMWDAATRHRTDGALVRVVVPAQDPEEARRTAREFAAQLVPVLPAYLPR